MTREEEEYSVAKDLCLAHHGDFRPIALGTTWPTSYPLLPAERTWRGRAAVGDSHKCRPMPGVTFTRKRHKP